MSIDVTLDWREVVFAAEVGVKRHVTNRSRGNGHRYGAPTDQWSSDIHGALAELAFAKATNRYWQPVVNDPQSLPGDVGREQIRTTTRDNGCLILHPKDPDLARFWLITGQSPTFRIIGWIRGSDGKRPEWWREGDGRPAFFVPQSALAAPTSEALAA